MECLRESGRDVGEQTYRIIINDGEIADRKRVGGEDNCVSEKYTPI